MSILKRKVDDIKDKYSITFTQNDNCVNVNLDYDSLDENKLYYYYKYYGSSTRASDIEIFSNKKSKVFNFTIIKNDTIIKSLDISGDDVLSYKSEIPSINDKEIKLNLCDIQIVLTLKFRHLYKWENSPTELSGVILKLH